MLGAWLPWHARRCEQRLGSRGWASAMMAVGSVLVAGAPGADCVSRGSPIDDGQVLFHLRSGPPIAVPGRIGRGVFPWARDRSCCPVRRKQRCDREPGRPDLAARSELRQARREAGARRLVRELRDDPRHVVRAAQRRTDPPTQSSPPRSDRRAGRAQRPQANWRGT